MKIHILPVGFTSEVFTNASSAIVKEGADRLIALHMPFPDKDVKLKVEKTIYGVEQAFGTKVDPIILHASSFSGLIHECIRILNSLKPEDQIFIHLGGGERHLGLALVYASFFVKRRILHVPVLEYGFKEGKKFQYEQFPSVVPQYPTTAQKKVLKILKQNKGQRLSEIIARLGGSFESKAPSLLRHLRNLIDMHLATYDPKTKEYYASKLSGFLTS